MPATANVPQPAATVKEAPLSTEPREVFSGRKEPIRPHLKKMEDGSYSRSGIAAEAPPTSSPSRDDAPVPAGLKVNGIALQDDPGESVAVINGALVKKGMSVGGARVEEILQDRVRFSSGGGTFYVQLSK